MRPYREPVGTRSDHDHRSTSKKNVRIVTLLHCWAAPRYFVCRDGVIAMTWKAVSRAGGPLLDSEGFRQ